MVRRVWINVCTIHRMDVKSEDPSAGTHWSVDTKISQCLSWRRGELSPTPWNNSTFLSKQEEGRTRSRILENSSIPGYTGCYLRVWLPCRLKLLHHKKESTSPLKCDSWTVIFRYEGKPWSIIHSVIHFVPQNQTSSFTVNNEINLLTRWKSVHNGMMSSYIWWQFPGKAQVRRPSQTFTQCRQEQ